MRLSLTAFLCCIALVAADAADEGVPELWDYLWWGVAYLNCLLFGWLLGWLISRLAPDLPIPQFAWHWFNFFQDPRDRTAHDGKIVSLGK